MRRPRAARRSYAATSGEFIVIRVMTAAGPRSLEMCPTTIALPKGP